jgi:hypothetical protein
MLPKQKRLEEIKSPAKQCSPEQKMVDRLSNGVKRKEKSIYKQFIIKKSLGYQKASSTSEIKSLP